MVNELWLPVVGYESVYEVSDMGSVRRVAPNPTWKPARTYREYSPRILKRLTDRKGYHFVALSRHGIVRQFRIHTLVVAAFIRPVPSGMTVNHKDGHRTNNNIGNLEIATYKENNRHAIDVLGLKHKGPRGERASKAKLTSAQVIEIRARRTNGERIKDLAVEYGVHVASISSLINGHTWTHI